jgi:hypothetical protein
MASYNSNEWANRVAVPAISNKTYVDGGRVRVKTFSFTTPAGLLANDTLNLCELPVGAHVIGGRLVHGAMGASATLSIGISGAVGKYLSAYNIAAAGQTDFANTVALNTMTELTADERIFATMSGAAWASGQVLKGYILYSKD